ncbi:MAG: hypothetical protein HLUCCO02_08765 [Idiomarinaceae bacterium HL-53]|nr:MAG: hypothetical protein HLUCCO02_08765 [Idiomarinaceae bacterium HL-53]
MLFIFILFLRYYVRFSVTRIERLVSEEKGRINEEIWLDHQRW